MTDVLQKIKIHNDDDVSKFFRLIIMNDRAYPTVGLDMSYSNHRSLETSLPTYTDEQAAVRDRLTEQTIALLGEDRACDVAIEIMEEAEATFGPYPYLHDWHNSDEEEIVRKYIADPAGFLVKVVGDSVAEQIQGEWKKAP